VPSPILSFGAVRGRVLDRQRCFRQLTKRGFKNLPQEFIKGNYEQYWFVYCIFYNGVNQKRQIIGFLADMGDFYGDCGIGSLPTGIKLLKASVRISEKHCRIITYMVKVAEVPRPKRCTYERGTCKNSDDILLKGLFCLSSIIGYNRNHPTMGSSVDCYNNNLQFRLLHMST
jgi:hypothetical protein